MELEVEISDLKLQALRIKGGRGAITRPTPKQELSLPTKVNNKVLKLKNQFMGLLNLPYAMFEVAIDAISEVVNERL